MINQTILFESNKILTFELVGNYTNEILNFSLYEKQTNNIVVNYYYSTENDVYDFNVNYDEEKRISIIEIKLDDNVTPGSYYYLLARYNKLEDTEQYPKVLFSGFVTIVAEIKIQKQTQTQAPMYPLPNNIPDIIPTQYDKYYYLVVDYIDNAWQEVYTSSYNCDLMTISTGENNELIIKPEDYNFFKDTLFIQLSLSQYLRPDIQPSIGGNPRMGALIISDLDLTRTAILFYKIKQFEQNE